MMIDLAQRSPSNPIKRYRIRQYGPITAILLIAAALYLFQIGTESIWLDEAFSIRDAQNLALKGNNAVRPLYYLVLHVWMIFGMSEAWLRSLSVLFGLSSIFAAYLIGCRVANKATGLLAALLMALSPLLINHAQEVRMYTLGAFLGLAGTLALIHTLEKPFIGNIRCWAGFRLLMVLTTPLNVLLLGPDLLLLLVRFRQQQRVLVAVTKWLIIASIAWLPFALSLARATPSFMGGWVAKVDPPNLLDGITLPLKSFTAYGMQVTSLSQFMPFHAIYVAALAFLLGIGLLNIRYFPKLLWVTAWALIPLTLVFVASHLSSSLWYGRYLIFTAPYILILLAAGYRWLWQHQRVVAGLIGFIYAISVSSALVHYYRVQDHEDWRGVGKMISQYDQPGDVIVMSKARLRHALTYYYDGAAPIYGIKGLFTDSGFPLLEQLGKQGIRETLSQLPPAPRLWLVYQHVGVISESSSSMFESILRDQFQVQQHQEFVDIDLFLLTSPVNQQS